MSAPELFISHDPMCIGLAEDWRGNQPCDCKRVQKIRADERSRLYGGQGWVAQKDVEAWLTDLQAKVDELPIHEFDEVSTHSGYRAIVTREGLCRRDVLDLLDEVMKP